MTSSAKFIYVEFGDNKRYKLELLYSLSTLLKHNKLEATDVIIYTETPDFYKSINVTIISIKDRVQTYSNNWTYTFRIKPCVIVEALREFNCPILFLDTDTIIKANLSPLINAVSDKQVFLNRLEKINPYPSITQFATSLPHSGNYQYDHIKSWMHNSGIIAVNELHIPIFEDAIHLLDDMRLAGIEAHTIEQTALSEILRINKIKVGGVKSSVVAHYCRGAEKEYMAHQLFKRLGQWHNDGLPSTKSPIRLSWIRARAFKRFSFDFG